MINTSSIYNTDAWKKAREEFIRSRGSVCEMCGRRAGEVVKIKTRKGKEKEVRISLSVHHKDPPPYGLKLYKKIVNQLFRETVGNPKTRDSNPIWAIYEKEARLALGSKANARKIYEYAKKQWSIDNQELVQKKFKEAKQKAQEEYLKLTPENAIVLCQRCHLARERGLRLCPICKTYYYRPSPFYPDACYRCNKEVRT